MARASSLALLLVLLAVSQISALEHFIFCIPGCPPPQVDEYDTIEVYYQEAPVFEGALGDEMSKYNAFHSSFGFRDVTTGQNWTIEYDAYSEVPNATFPYTVIEPNGTKELVWYNRGAICIFPYINNTYWSHRVTYMTVINGSMFNEFVNWTVQDNQSYPIYELFGAYSGMGGEEWIRPSTCVEFNWRGFCKLSELGAVFDEDLHPEHDFITLYVNKPTPVDYDDLSVRAQIIAFYDQMKGLNIHNSTSLLNHLVHFVEGNKYLYAYGTYYLLDFVYPYFEFTYTYDPVPQAPQCIAQWGVNGMYTEEDYYIQDKYKTYQHALMISD